MAAALANNLGLAVLRKSERGCHLDLHDLSYMPRSPVMFAPVRFAATPMVGRAPFNLLMRNIRAATPDLSWREATEWTGHLRRPTPFR